MYQGDNRAGDSAQSSLVSILIIYERDGWWMMVELTRVLYCDPPSGMQMLARNSRMRCAEPMHGGTARARGVDLHTVYMYGISS